MNDLRQSITNLFRLKRCIPNAVQKCMENEQLLKIGLGNVESKTCTRNFIELRW